MVGQIGGIRSFGGFGGSGSQPGSAAVQPAQLIYFKCLIVALKQKRHGAKKCSSGCQMAEKGGLNGEPSGPKVIAMALNALGGPLRRRKQNDEVAPSLGTR